LNRSVHPLKFTVIWIKIKTQTNKVKIFLILFVLRLYFHALLIKLSNVDVLDELLLSGMHFVPKKIEEKPISRSPLCTKVILNPILLLLFFFVWIKKEPKKIKAVFIF